MTGPGRFGPLRRQRRGWPRLPGLLLAFVACGAASAGLGSELRAQFVAPEGRSYHNGASLPLADEGDGAQALRDLREALERDEPDTAAGIVRGLRSDPRDLLVPLSTRVDAPALEAAARLLVASGDSACHRRVLEEARAVQAEARRARDLDVLLDQATRGFALETAREAALAAARLLHEEGRWWEAAALATRAGALPGAAELAAAAGARLAASPEAPPVADAATESQASRWSLEGSVLLPLDEDPYAGLPLVTDGRPGELLFADARVLFPLQRATSEITLRPFDVASRLLGGGTIGLDLPSVSRHELVNAGPPEQPRLIFPLNALQIHTSERFREFRRDPTIPRSGRLEAVVLGGADIHELWAAHPPAVAGEEAVSTALGPPLLAGSRVFSLVFRVGLSTDVSLACFAVEDGRLLFETPLVNAVQIKRFASRLAQTSLEDLDKTGGQAALAVRDGIVYACTGHGVFAAIDGVTGRLRHTFRYDRVFSLDPGTYDPAFLFDTGGWDDEPVRLWPGRVVIAPADSRFLYMLAEEPGPNGQLILDDPIERLDRLNVAALVPDPQGRPSPAVLCTRRRGGRGGMVLLGPDGHTLARSSPLPASADISGRPLHVGTRVLVPTTEGVFGYAVGDLVAPPELLGGGAGADATADPAAAMGVAGLYAIRDGVATLAPRSGRPAKRSSWLLRWYTADPPPAR